MITLFSRDDFTLCDVPVPQGYPQSQTHCSFAVVNNACYLSTSPFPARRNKATRYLRAIIRKVSFKTFCNDKRAESYENPCIYKAQFSHKTPPVMFKPMSLRPLMEMPDPVYGYPSFNSDPELLFEDNKIYVLNRSTYRKEKGYVNRLYLIEGVDENGWFKMLSIKMLKEEERPFVSPCLIKYQNRFVMTYLETNSYNDGKTFNGLYFTYLNDINQMSSIEAWTEIKIDNNNYLPWHMSLFSYNGKLYTIMACVEKGKKNFCRQMLGEFSDDLNSLKIYQTPLTDYNSYRSSAHVTDDGLFILYNTTVDENVDGGKSVDGREIIVASMDFKNVLIFLQSNER